MKPIMPNPRSAPASTPQFDYRKLATMLGYLSRAMEFRGHARVSVPKVNRNHRLSGFDRFSIEDVDTAALEAERLAREVEGR